MRTIRMVVEYEGTRYGGWQRQPNRVTIQQRLEEAVERITGEAPGVIGAGRTDAGVHATGQAASFRTASETPPARLGEALNAVLPEDIGVKNLEDAPEDFHARYGARSKRYEYTIRNARARCVFGRERCWLVKWPLDLDLMRSGAEAAVGTHDFSAFEASGSSARHAVRTVTTAEWQRRGDQLIFGIEGDGFLYNMVRIIVGGLVEVGRGKTPLDAFREAMESRERTQAGPTAPAKGLCLVKVSYDGWASA